MIKIGDTVTYVDPVQEEHFALVTAVWGAPHGMAGDDGPKPSINLVYVSGSENETDQYGRQTKHATSIPNQQHQLAPGNYWK
jgi:hypothetical protein